VSSRNYASKVVGFPNPRPLDELLSNPTQLREAIELERRAKQPPPGWSGLSVLSRADWQLSLALGDNVRQVDVAPNSPAWREGIRPGNFIQPIAVNGAPALPLEELDAVALRRGDLIVVHFCKHDRGRASGWVPVMLTLAAAPRLAAIPDWKKTPQIPCGRRVQRSERVRFLNEMRARTDITAGMYKALATAVFKFDNHHNAGFWPSYASWARELNCSRRAIINIVNRLRWIGVIKVNCGPTKNRATNLFTVTWPSHMTPPTSQSGWV
jgi:hypothetical protein